MPLTSSILHLTSYIPHPPNPLYRFTPQMEALCRRLTMREALQVTRELGGPAERLLAAQAAT